MACRPNHAAADYRERHFAGRKKSEEAPPNPPHGTLSIDIAISDGYHGPMKVSVAEAKNKLPQLVKAAENGQRITICRRGKPVADLVRTSAPDKKKPKLGTLRDKVIIHDSDWWKPMTDEEVDALLEDRD